MTERPILTAWDGESFSPVNQGHARIADQDYVVGARYAMAPVEDRSMRSHRHYFSCIRDAWENLPEGLAEGFATPDHLRRFALIKAGYRDERSIVCASKAEAQRVAAFIRPMDEYALVTVREAVVIVYTPKSQSLRAMGKREFQESKDAVLTVLSHMIGVTPKALRENTDRAA